MKTRRTINTGKGVIVSILAVCSAVLAIVALPVSAAIFDVATFDDELADGNGCSLREAIVNANDNAQTYADCPKGEAGPVVDVINLPAGTYTLMLAGVDELCENPAYYTGSGTPTACLGTTDAYVPVVAYDASQGDLDITDDLTIIGEGSDVTTIKWASVPTGDTDPLTGDRIFHVAVTASATADIASVVIQGLTVANGEVALKPTRADDVCLPKTPLATTAFDATQLNAYDIQVIDNTCGVRDDEGKLSTVDTSVVIDQFRRMGGGMAIGGGFATVHYDSKLEGLPPVVESGGEGSTFGVENISLDDVGVISNWSGGDGGGVFSVVPGTIGRAKISGNISAGGNGGGLYGEANMTISDTLIGRVINAASITAYPDLANRNEAENGGAIFFTGAPQTTLTILRSALNGNYAIGGAGIAGREATFDIANTTISTNEARDLGAGIITSGDVYLQNVTVADNIATTPSPSGGGGLNGFSNARFYLSNTLLANNQLVYTGKPTRYDNCGITGSNAQFISQGYNLEDKDTCFLDQASDLNNTDPKLAALDMLTNGGLTETHALTFVAVGNPNNSPALETGDDSNCPNNDQRGSIRPFDADENGSANCDIGAFELANFTADLQISNMVAPDEVFKGDQFTVEVTVLNNTANPDTNVTLVTDALPAEVTFVSASAGCSEAAGVVTCSIGNLANGADAIATLTLSAAKVGDAVITATVSSDSTPDNNPDNDTHSVTVGVIGESDLQLTATANTSSVVVGNEVTVTFTVANLGDDDATDVSLFGTIPVEASLVSAIPDNGTTCTQTGADVFCALGNLAVAGPSINVVAVLRADLVGVAGSTVINVSATADAKQRDPDLSNNTVSASVTITAASAPPPSGSSDSGWCSYNPDARFDPMLPGLVLAALTYLGWRLKRKRAN